MSADNLIYVQLNSEGKLVAQHWSASNEGAPDPEKAQKSCTFDTMTELIAKMGPEANETEYGFDFSGVPQYHLSGFDTAALAEPAEGFYELPHIYSPDPLSVQARLFNPKSDDDINEIALWVGAKYWTRESSIEKDFTDKYIFTGKDLGQVVVHVGDWIVKGRHEITYLDHEDTWTMTDDHFKQIFHLVR